MTMREQDTVRTTDIAPLAKKVIARVRVKIQISGDHARITSKDRKIDIVVPALMVQKRMPGGAAVCYFVAQIPSTSSSVEIADRIELSPGEQW